jgi:predicted nucleotidyltransferase
MISAVQKDIIIKNLSPYKPKKLGVFGSYARGENNANSDLDLLVEFGVRISLLDLAGLEQHLSECLGVKVDLVTERALSKHVRPYVEKDYLSILP